MLIERVEALAENGYYEEAFAMLSYMMDTALEQDFDEEFICMFMWTRIVNLLMDLDGRILMADF